jgi:hypothetical protein
MSVKVKLNLKKLAEEINSTQKSFNTNLIGKAIVQRMKQLIFSGISPIEGNGRFPAYKGVGSVKSLETLRKSLLTEARIAKEAKKLGEGSADPRYASRAASKVGSKLASLKSRTYPFSVQDEFPDKKPRPVNLRLSGKFLSKLKYQVKSKNVVEVGFFDQYGKDLEDGHREGTNGQLERPIIPQEGEKFVNSIRLAILKALRGS